MWLNQQNLPEYGFCLDWTNYSQRPFSGRKSAYSGSGDLLETPNQTT